MKKREYALLFGILIVLAISLFASTRAISMLSGDDYDDQKSYEEFKTEAGSNDDYDDYQKSYEEFKTEAGSNDDYDDHAPT